LKISNLCNHNTSTLRTDRQTDGQTTCHSNTALCVASRGKNICTVTRQLALCRQRLTSTDWWAMDIKSNQIKFI